MKCHVLQQSFRLGCDQRAVSFRVRPRRRTRLLHTECLEDRRLLALIGPVFPPPFPADITDDGVVDVADILAILAAWGACP